MNDNEPDLTIPAPGEAVNLARGLRWMRLPVPGPLDHVNVWAIEGAAGVTLIDCGVYDPVVTALWRDHLLPMLGRPVERVIVTHLHPDHVGCAGWLTARLHCPLWMTPAEFRGAAALVAAANSKAPPAFIAFLRAAGWPADMLAHADELHGRYGNATAPMPEDFVPVGDGQLLTIGGQPWRAISGGGHSPDHLCLLREDGGILIGGDVVLRGGAAVVPLLFDAPDADPLADWLATLERVGAALTPDTLILPSHGEPFTGGPAVVQAIVRRHETKLERVHAALASPSTAVGLLSARPDETANSLGLRTAEMLACLNHLLVKRRIRRERVDGIHYYARA